MLHLFTKGAAVGHMELYELIDKVKLAGYKCTKPRVAVLETLVKLPKSHFNSEEIHRLIKNSYPQIGLATVYRTLTLFERIGIICKLDLDDGFFRYELKRPNENHRHHHLICTNCGHVTEVEDDLLDSLEAQIHNKYKFQIKDHCVKFYGLCEPCWVKLRKI